jgi:hypothetical protein
VLLSDFDNIFCDDFRWQLLSHGSDIAKKLKSFQLCCDSLRRNFSLGMVSDDVRCRCDEIAMLKATSQIRRIAVAPGV